MDTSDQYQTPGRGEEERMKDGRKESSFINLSAGLTLCRQSMGWQQWAERADKTEEWGVYGMKTWEVSLGVRTKTLG